MRAWLAESPCSPDQLRLTDLPTLSPQVGHLLVRVEAAGLNFSDLLMITGTYQVRPPLPFTPGQEVSGTVVQGSSAFPEGSRVASKVQWGGFADFALVREDMAIHVPDAVPSWEAAALPVVYPTAYIALRARGNAQPGETILVHAAAGAVGAAAVQVAKAFGLTVIATAGSDSKLGLCRELGADHILNYRTTDWVAATLDLTNGRGVDLIFDSVGGQVTGQSLKVLAASGRLLIVGFSSGDIPVIKANRLLLRSASAVGVYWSHDRPEDRPLIDEAVEAILHLRDTGAVRLVADDQYPFQELPRALQALADRITTGKPVLLMNDASQEADFARVSEHTEESLR